MRSINYVSEGTSQRLCPMKPSARRYHNLTLEYLLPQLFKTGLPPLFMVLEH